MRMAEPKPFLPVKLIAGLISSSAVHFEEAEKSLVARYGPADLKSPCFPFGLTDYYEKQMGRNLQRVFLSFAGLISPDKLGAIKIETNALEESLRHDSGRRLRVVNIDPGMITASALIMATAKDFAHRIPLAGGIYAHLEFLFTKSGIKTLDWTYPDFRQSGYEEFFLSVRRTYLGQLKLMRSREDGKNSS
jgi:hypothetical protein